MRVNRIKWSNIKLRWEGRVAAAHVFKGIHDYENWAMSQQPQPPMDNPFTGMMDEIRDNLESLEEGEWMNPEEFNMVPKGPLTDKDKLFERAKVLRAQIDEAIGREDYETAQVLNDTLNVVHNKWKSL